MGRLGAARPRARATLRACNDRRVVHDRRQEARPDPGRRWAPRRLGRDTAQAHRRSGCCGASQRRLGVRARRDRRRDTAWPTSRSSPTRRQLPPSGFLSARAWSTTPATASASSGSSPTTARPTARPSTRLLCRPLGDPPPPHPARTGPRPTARPSGSSEPCSRGWAYARDLPRQPRTQRRPRRLA